MVIHTSHSGSPKHEDEATKHSSHNQGIMSHVSRFSVLSGLGSVLIILNFVVSGRNGSSVMTFLRGDQSQRARAGSTTEDPNPALVAGLDSKLTKIWDTSTQIVEATKALDAKLQEIMDAQKADGDNAVNRERKLELLQGAIEAAKESILQQRPDPTAMTVPQQTVSTITDDTEKLKRLQKYINVYNYTAPWEIFMGPNEECGEGPDFNKFFALPGTKRSRLNEDKIIYNNFFKNKMPPTEVGNYIEMGAFDGVTEANTRFYDLCLGWKGLLIEGNPRIFPLTRLARPRTHRISFAPSCSAEYEATKKTVEFHAALFTNGGMEDSAMAYKNTAVPKVAVPCGPLSPVVEDIFEKERVHFFSLDVEGAERTCYDCILCFLVAVLFYLSSMAYESFNTCSSSIIYCIHLAYPINILCQCILTFQSWYWKRLTLVRSRLTCL